MIKVGPTKCAADGGESAASQSEFNASARQFSGLESLPTLAPRPPLTHTVGRLSCIEESVKGDI